MLHTFLFKVQCHLCSMPFKCTLLVKRHQFFVAIENNFVTVLLFSNRFQPFDKAVVESAHKRETATQINKIFQWQKKAWPLQRSQVQTALAVENDNVFEMANICTSVYKFALDEQRSTRHDPLSAAFFYYQNVVHVGSLLNVSELGCKFVGRNVADSR